MEWIGRFWAKVEVTSSCWLWTGAKFANGYGAFQLQGKAQRAHRLSWMLANGDIPEGALICHHCDTPACVNPEHLYAGTPKSNMEDRDRRGRHRLCRGEQHPMARLTEAAVADIRERWRVGTRQGNPIADELAALYGVSTKHVRQVAVGDRWRDDASSS